MDNRTRIVGFSGGLQSYVAAKRTIAKHGRERTVLLFADTKSEDADLYRFLDDAENKLGVPVTRIADGRDIWQVFKDERYMGNSRLDPCSKILKRQMIDRWLRETYTPETAVNVIGYHWSEPHRIEKYRLRSAPWDCEFPLAEPPYLGPTAMRREVESDGLKVPRLYDLGAKHNNCGGGCVKAGKAHWKWVLSTLPCVFAEWEAKEQEIRDHLGRDDVSMLAGGVTLREFRLMHEFQPLPLADQDDWGACHCVDA